MLSNIKIYVPDRKINMLVQKVLLEHGVRWVNGSSHKNELYDGFKFIYIDGDAMTYTPTKSERFRSVHYLQLLTGCHYGNIFKHKEDQSIILVLNRYAYWLDGSDLVGHHFDNDDDERTSFVESDQLVEVNVFEEEINMSNMRPKLEAGKHVIKHKAGDYYFVLEDKNGILFGVKFDGSLWISDILNNSITEIHEIPRGTDAANVTHYERCKTLIWKRNDRSDKLKEQYSEMEKQMQELKAKMDELGKEINKGE